MSNKPIIIWFRRDLRLGDHAMLTAAQATGRPVIPVFILDSVVETLGAAPKWRLGEGVAHFQRRLEALGSRLILRRGEALDVLQSMMDETGADTVYWSRAYDPVSIARDRAVKAAVNGISFQGHLLYEPWVPKTKMGGNFKVYTPFWHHVYRALEVDAALPAVTQLRTPDAWPDSDTIDDWQMGAAMNRGAMVVARHAHVGEEAAHARLDRFLEEAVQGYKEDRDFPMLPATSGLSENLTYGEISPRVVFNAGRAALEQGMQGGEHFLKELVWREFAYHLLWYAPALDHKCWRTQWDDFPWRGESANSMAWKQGRTGQTFVDAGMRELYTTGIMHNRLRMIVGSYLTKHLLTDWRVGLAWFAECLIDWDPAANAMGWQWIAGCGPDASPYFRVFNPALQADKFDKDQGYRDKWLRAEISDDAAAFYDAVPLSWALSRKMLQDGERISLTQGRVGALEAYAAFKAGQA